MKKEMKLLALSWSGWVLYTAAHRFFQPPGAFQGDAMASSITRPSAGYYSSPGVSSHASQVVGDAQAVQPSAKANRKQPPAKAEKGFRLWWAMAREAFSEWSKDNASMQAAALAYYTIFSIAP